MKSIRLAAVAAAAALTGGCVVVALQPVYSDDSIVFEERLVGQWENVEDRTSAAIDRSEWRAYRVAYTDRSTTTTFYGNLTQIDKVLFLDLTQARGLDSGPYLIPVHGVYRIAMSGDTLCASALDYGWFTQELELKKIGRLSVALDGRRNVALGASTTELREWLAHAPDEAFAAPMTFTRKR